MRTFLFFCIAAILSAPAHTGAQDGFSERAKKYADQYATLAMFEQRKNGIPAAITLGQGILETEAGASELMTEANNHFGIKCKNGWQGETFSHTDDLPDECFKKYKCAAESYGDHSEHLKRNQRYSPLFKIKKTDYKSWAVCLKKCGYATNPQYAQKLIKIIEDYGLQQYTYSALDSSVLNNYRPENPVVKNEPVIIAQPVSYTYSAKIKGNDTGVVANKQHKVLAGETLASIAQAEGIELRKLQTLNFLNPNEEPVAGEVLELEAVAKTKPAVKVTAITAHKGNAIVYSDEKNPSSAGDYVTINRSRSKPDTAKPKVVKTTPAATPAVATQTAPEKPKPIIIITEPERRPTRPAERPDPDDPAVKKETEFTALKAELDKVVYADDSQLITETTPASEKKPVVTPEKKPAAPDKKRVVHGSPAATGKFYTVKKGDTAFSIAKKNGITVDQLTEWNNISADQIKAGQTLQVKE